VPIEARKRRLRDLLRGAHSSVVLNEPFEDDGAIIYKLACKLGTTLDTIVSPHGRSGSKTVAISIRMSVKA
jgi:hypothetical protein